MKNSTTNYSKKLITGTLFTVFFILCSLVSAVEVTTKFTSNGQWWANFDISIKNNSDKKIDGWQIEFEYPYELQTPGSAVLVSHNGNTYIYKNQSWDSAKIIQPNGILTLSYGFSPNGKSVTELPNNLKFTSDSITPDPDPDPTPVPPVANNDNTTSYKNSSVLIDVLSNDTDSNSESLTISSLSSPSNGTASIENNKIKYMPNNEYTGNDSFRYTIINSLGLTATATVSVKIVDKPQLSKINATYWCAWGGNESYPTNGSTIYSNGIPMDQIDSSYNVIITAFIITSNGNFELSLGDPSNNTTNPFSKAAIKEYITKTKAQGRKVLVSLGGAEFDLKIQNASDANKYRDQVSAIITEYGFEGLDIDIESSLINKQQIDVNLLANSTLEIINNFKAQNIDFWLTAAPEWPYVIPYTYGSAPYSSHPLASDFYKNLINKIGIDNFNYIWPQTYNQGSANGVTGYDKSKVTPGNGMDRFLAAMAWAGTTTEGFSNNGSIGILIPSEKFVLGIPATDGAAGGNGLYTVTEQQIKNAWEQMQSENTQISGFMNWSADWDAKEIKDGELSVNYSHQPWGTGKKIAEVIGLSPIEINTPPSVSISSPYANASIPQSTFAPIHITIQASDSDGTITSKKIKVGENEFLNTDSASWTPTAYGTVTIFAYATDDDNVTSSTSINITIAKPNTPVLPVANNDTVSTIEETAVTINPLSNDTGEGISLSNITTPSNGSATISGNTVIYTPNTNFVGTDSFNYTIKDTNDKNSSASVTVNITEKQNNENEKSFTVNGTTIKFTIGSVWDGSYQINGNVSGAQKGWTMDMKFNNGSVVSSSWGISENTTTANQIKNNDWSTGDGSFTLGMSGNKSLPSSITFNGKSSGGDTDNGTAPDITVVTPLNNDTKFMEPIEAVSIETTVTDQDNDLDTVSISVDGNIYDSTSASWTPSKYGQHNITVTAKDKKSNTSTKNITVYISKPNVIPTGSGTVKGWPNYIAMGSCFIGSDYDMNSLAARKDAVHSMFTYDGNGAGDTGSIIEGTTKTLNIMNKLEQFKLNYGKNIMPTFVFYTVNASGSATETAQDLYNDENLWMHYYNYIYFLKTINDFKGRVGIGDIPATVILNPDFLGEVHKSGDVDIYKEIKVRTAIQKAINRAEQNGTITKSITIPTQFNDNNTLKGYIASLNWLTEELAPTVPYSWQINVWAGDPRAHLWIHAARTNPAEITTNVANTIAFLNQLEVFNGTYQPDFITFDKYERDVFPGHVSAYMYNAGDMDVFIKYAGGVSKGLNNIPVMLWQIPGGHMQTLNDIDTRGYNGSTEPDYIFGNDELSSDLSNVADYIKNINITPFAGSYYVPTSTTIIDYLQFIPGTNTKGYDWSKNNFNQLKDANIFSILWGGGSTTGIVGQNPSTDDNGWLYGKVMNYLANPTPINDDESNISPNVSITSPIANAEETQSTFSPINITIQATDSDGTIKSKKIKVGENEFLNTDSASWTPTAYGTVTIFAYATDDDNATSSNSINITITKPNTPILPVANNDTASTVAENSVSIDVLANDIGEGIQLNSVTAPSNGSTVVSGNAVLYTPNTDFSGTDSFNYTITDGNSNTASGSVIITITEKEEPSNPPSITFVNRYDGEIIKQESLSAIQISINVMDEDNDIKDSKITVGGTTINGTSRSWLPDTFGSFTIIAEASDLEGNTAFKTITIIIQKSEEKEGSTRQIIGYISQWDNWSAVTKGYPSKGSLHAGNIDLSKYTILNFSFFGVANDGSLHSADFRNKAMKSVDSQGYDETAVQSPAPLLHPDKYSSWDIPLLYGDTTQFWSINSYLISLGYESYNGGWKNNKTNTTGSFPLTEKIENGSKGLFDLCKENNVKLMASIGGWSMCKHFPEMANDSSKRSKFLSDCKTLIEMGFDGIDIDWEYPGSAGMNISNYSDQDYHNFTILMQEIRNAIGDDKIITAAFSAVPTNLDKFEWELLDKEMNYYNIMSYDLNGGWSEKAGHNSALYGNSNEFSWDRTFKYLTQTKNVNPEKINMGLAFYGRGVQTQGQAHYNASTLKTMQSFFVDGTVNSSADLINWQAFEGSPTYSYIKNNTQGWTEYWDDTAKVPYMTKDNFFLSYDNLTSVREKANYVVNNNAGGVIIWTVFGDLDFSQATLIGGETLKVYSNVKAPLLEEVANTFGN